MNNGISNLETGMRQEPQMWPLFSDAYITPMNVGIHQSDII